MTAIFTPQPGYQYVPVRPEHVGAVKELLATLETPAIADLATEDERDALITDDLLADIAKGSKKTTVIISEILDILAEAPEKPVNLAELADRTGRTLSQLQTVWTHLTRYMRARFGHKHWPVRMRSGYRFEPPIGGDEVYVWVTDDVATRWRAVRGK